MKIYNGDINVDKIKLIHPSFWEPNLNIINISDIESNFKYLETLNGHIIITNNFGVELTLENIKVINGNIIISFQSKFNAPNLEIVNGNVMLYLGSSLIARNLEIITKSIDITNGSFYPSKKLYRNFNKKYFKPEINL